MPFINAKVKATQFQVSSRSLRHPNTLQKGHLPFNSLLSLPSFLFVSLKMMSAAK